jgi:hypothetical protein
MQVLSMVSEIKIRVCLIDHVHVFLPEWLRVCLWRVCSTSKVMQQVQRRECGHCLTHWACLVREKDSLVSTKKSEIITKILWTVPIHAAQRWIRWDLRESLHSFTHMTSPVLLAFIISTTRDYQNHCNKN